MEQRGDNEDDQFFFSHAPRMPEDDLIMSEAVILTGGRDQHGRPIIAFPARYHGILESKVKASGMDNLLRYFIDITRAADRKRGFAFVTDLRFSTLDFILLMKSTLNSIQTEMKGAIGMCIFYAILPLNKKTHKDTLTHLALRQSKKKINKNIVPPYFQSVAVNDEMELYNYIEKSHLTPELGGYLQYAHRDWVTFRKIVEPFFANFESVQIKIPNMYQRLDAMDSVTGGNNKEQLQQTHSQLQAAYFDIRRGLHLDQVLHQCEELLARFHSCDEEDVFTVLAQKPIFKETKEMVEGCYEILVAARKKIEEDWSRISGKITQAVQVIVYRMDVNKLLDWFKSKQGRDLRQGADIADNLSQAEILLNHFKTGLLVKAEEKLSKVSELVEQGEVMAVDGNNHRLSEIVTLTKTLKQESQDFQNALQKHQHILHSVYQFHQLYNKARCWYVKCIRFLPSDLYDLHNDLRSHSQGHDWQALQLQWEEDVRRFLHKHPLLAKEELKKVKMIPEDVGATLLKKKGRLLSYRCLILTNLLSHSEKTSTTNIKDMMKWQAEIQSQSDDSASHRSEILSFHAQMRKTPSDSRLDKSPHRQWHNNLDSKRQSTVLKDTKVMKEHSYKRSAQTPERSRKHNRHTDRYDRERNDTDNDDPLLQRLGHVGSFYDRLGDNQGQIVGVGHDEDDIGRHKVEDTQGNPNGKRMSNKAQEYTQQTSPSQQFNSSNQYVQRDHSPSRQSTMEHNQQTSPWQHNPSNQYFHPEYSPSRQPKKEHVQTYGIYGDSDFEDDTAVIIHHQEPHTPQGLPEHLLPGNQVQYQGITHSDSQQLAPSINPSNIALGDQQLNYGLIRQDPDQTQSSYSSARHSTQRGTGSVLPQQGKTTPHSAAYAHQRHVPVNFNSNNNSCSTDSPIQPDSHPLPYNVLHPSLPLLQTSYVNDVTSSKEAPISFHGSLMNIHHPHVDNEYSSVGGLGTEHNEAMFGSPVMRHRSLMNLSHSPNMDQAGNLNLQYNSKQISPASGQHNRHQPQNGLVANLSMDNGGIYPTYHNFQSPQDTAVSRLRHGVSEPSISTSLPEDSTSPYSHVLTKPINLRALSGTIPVQPSRIPLHPGLKNAKISPSARPLSRSETELKYSPHNQTSSPGLPHSEHLLHHSELDLRQTVPNTHSMAVSPSVVLTQGDLPDPQVEYYKQLYATSTPQQNHSTTASGQRTTDHTLDPAFHTWMHAVPSTNTTRQLHLSDQMPSASRPLSPLALLEIEVAKETMDAEEAVKEDKYNEQIRREAMIDTILGQSEPSIRSHDYRASPDQATPSNGHRGQRSGTSRKQKKINFQSSPKVDKQRVRNSSLRPPISREAHHMHVSQHKATDITSPQIYQMNKGKKTTSLPSQQGSLVSENGWRVRYHGDASVTSRKPQNAFISPPSVLEQSVTTPRTLTIAERQLGLSTTLPQEQSIRPVQALDQPNQRRDHLTADRISPAVYSKQTFGDLQRHSPYTTDVSFDRKMSALPINIQLRQKGDVDWRHEHLKELGLSPREEQPNLASGVKHINQSASDTNWRKQHLKDLGITPTMPHSSLTHDPTSKLKPSVNVSQSNDGDWRWQHLIELGISPSMHHPILNQVATQVHAPASSQANYHDWRHQHLLQLGITPGMYHQGKNQNSIGARGKPVEQKAPTDSDWQHSHLNELGMSPTMRQHSMSESATIEGSAEKIAPVTSRLRGVIGSGQSTNDIEGIHRLADETAKKSVRFAHLSDDSILDAEEQVQDELALRLHELELKLQAEEHSLMYNDVLDWEETGLDQQLRELDQQENGMQSNMNDQQTGHQVLLEGAAQPLHNKNGQLQPKLNEHALPPKLIKSSRPVQVSSSPGHRVQLESPNHSKHIQDSQYYRVDASQGHQVRHEGTEFAKQVKSKLSLSEGEAGSTTNGLNQEITTSGETVQNGNPGVSRTWKASPHKVISSQSERIKDKPSHNSTDDIEIRERINTDAASGKPVDDQYSAHASDQNHAESADMHDRRLGEAWGMMSSGLVNHARGQEISKPAGAWSNAQASDTRLERVTRLAESLQHADQLSTQSSLTNGDSLEQVTSNQEDNFGTVGVQTTNSPNAIKSTDLSEEELKFTERGQNKSGLSVTNPVKSCQTLVQSRDQKNVGPHCVEDEMTHEMGEGIAGDELRRSLLSERDHTAADYIACALGMEYVNDKANLTVQPYVSSKKSASQYENNFCGLESQENPRFEQSVSNDMSLNQEYPKHTRKLNLPNDSRAQEQGTNSPKAVDLTGSNNTNSDVNVRGLTSPHVQLPTFSSVLEEGPCSPIRQWLKEKETIETNDAESDQSKQSLAVSAMDEHTAKLELAHSISDTPVDAIQIKSPTLKSQHTSPIRQWLREKQEKEAYEGRKITQDLSDFGRVSEQTSDRRKMIKPVDVESPEDTRKSPNNTIGQTNSLIPIPVSSKKMLNIPKQDAKTPSQLGTRRRSSSSIPVYKGLSKSSPKTKQLSPSQTPGATPENSPEMNHTKHEIMKKHDISSKKGNQYSKIPVSKVYSALKDGGYLESTQQAKEQSLPQQVSPIKKMHANSAVEHSGTNAPLPETTDSRPVLEKQKTFTKEPRPILTREDTFTIEAKDGNKPSHFEVSPAEDTVVHNGESDFKNPHHAPLSPLALVLDHMVKKGSMSTTSKKREMPITQGGKKRHDSTEETFENSSTESSMSPTTKSTVIISKKPTTNLYNTKNYYVNVRDSNTENQREITQSKDIGREGNTGAYNGLTESDRKEQDDLDENELEKMMATKSQLAEMRNLEIENRHLAYERKEFEAHLIKNMQKQNLQTHSSDEG